MKWIGTYFCIGGSWIVNNDHLQHGEMVCGDKGTLRGSGALRSAAWVRPEGLGKGLL